FGELLAKLLRHDIAKTRDDVRAGVHDRLVQIVLGGHALDLGLGSLAHASQCRARTVSRAVAACAALDEERLACRRVTHGSAFGVALTGFFSRFLTALVGGFFSRFFG